MDWKAAHGYRQLTEQQKIRCKEEMHVSHSPGSALESQNYLTAVLCMHFPSHGVIYLILQHKLMS